MLSVNPSGVEIISDSIMLFYCCWSSHFPEDLYNLLLFSIHLCSYISQLLNDCSTPMVNIFCFSCSDYNNPLILINF